MRQICLYLSSPLLLKNNDNRKTRPINRRTFHIQYRSMQFE